MALGKVFGGVIKQGIVKSSRPVNRLSSYDSGLQNRIVKKYDDMKYSLGKKGQDYAKRAGSYVTNKARSAYHATGNMARGMTSTSRGVATSRGFEADGSGVGRAVRNRIGQNREMSRISARADDAVRGAYRTSDQGLGEAASGFGRAMSSMGRSTWNFLKKVPGSAIGDMVSAPFRAVGYAGKSLGRGIQSGYHAFDEATDKIADKAIAKYNSAAKTTGDFIDSAKDAVKGKFNTAGNYISGKYNTASNYVKESASHRLDQAKGAYGRASEALSEQAEISKENVAGMWGTLSSKASSGAHAVANAFSTAKTAVGKKFNDIGESISETASNVTGKVKNKISSLRSSKPETPEMPRIDEKDLGTVDVNSDSEWEKLYLNQNKKTISKADANPWGTRGKFHLDDNDPKIIAEREGRDPSKVSRDTKPKPAPPPKENPSKTDVTDSEPQSGGDFIETLSGYGDGKASNRMVANLQSQYKGVDAQIKEIQNNSKLSDKQKEEAINKIYSGFGKGVTDDASLQQHLLDKAKAGPGAMDYIMGYHVPEYGAGLAALAGTLNMALGNDKGQKTNAELYSNPF